MFSNVQDNFKFPTVLKKLFFGTKHALKKQKGGLLYLPPDKITKRWNI